MLSDGLQYYVVITGERLLKVHLKCPKRTTSIACGLVPYSIQLPQPLLLYSRQPHLERIQRSRRHGHLFYHVLSPSPLTLRLEETCPSFNEPYPGHLSNYRDRETTIEDALRGVGDVGTDSDDHRENDETGESRGGNRRSTLMARKPVVHT